MTSEDRFAADGISITIALLTYNKQRWWGQASHTVDGITIKAEVYAHHYATLLNDLWVEWEKKVVKVPNFIPRLAPPIEDAKYRDISPDGVNPLNDDIPF